MDRQGEDKREHPRIPIELRVEYPKLNAFFADYTKNISKGGTFIRTGKPLPIGTRFVFLLSVPSWPESLVLDGEVAWTRDDEETGMGIRFVFSDEGERRRLEAQVQRMMVESLGSDISQRLLAGD